VKSAMTKTYRSNRRYPDRCLPAIVAVSGSLVAFPASALELGELTVQSRLGQPLRASIAFALAPTEQLADYCVTLRPGPSVSGLPGFGPATVRVANGVIMLTGTTPVREPMVAAHVVVNCPYSANLSREFLLFFDPIRSASEPVYQQTTVTQQVSAQAEPVKVAPTAIERPVAPIVSEPVIKDIARSTRYQVQRGESLSEIAARIQNRPLGLWPAVNAIFEANPSAFLNNDPNNLKAGSWLSIPSFDGNAAVVAPVAAVAAVTPVAEIGSTNATNEAYEFVPVSEIVAVEEAQSVVAPLPAETTSEIILDDLADLGNSAGTLQSVDIIPDTALEGPTTTALSPNVPTAIITTSRTNDTSPASTSWFFWLGGSGIAAILGLLMFGRRLRGQADTSPAGPQTDESHQRRFSDTQAVDTKNIEKPAIDYNITDESPTEENLVLDADLIIGTGLSDAVDSDSSQDFDFTASTQLDIELPFEPVAAVSADKTDILPLPSVESHSILDSEVLPEDDGDDYDMSVIVDATKMPRHEDVTEHDLKAIEVAADEDTQIDESYTINEQVDYRILEQDYEDEMTATQALNQEITRAAAELNKSRNINVDGSTGDDTTALPVTNFSDLDVTAQMTAQNDDISDGDTGINEALTVNMEANEETVEMPLKSGKTA